MANDGLTLKQEKFVQELLRGKSQRAAYKAAFNIKNATAKSVDEKASSLFNTVKVQSRYYQLLDKINNKAVDQTEDLRQRVMQELEALAFSNGTDFASYGEVKYKDYDGEERTHVGVNVKHTNKVPRDKRGAISGYEQNQWGVKVKTYDKTKALSTLANILGMSAYDQHRIEIERRRLELDIWDKEKTVDPPASAQDNFIDALTSVAGEVWGTDDGVVGDDRPADSEPEKEED